MARHGPKNEIVKKTIQEEAAQAYIDVIERHRLADTPKAIGEWRTVPNSREHVRRGHVWELLAWYHHEVIRPEFTLRAWLRRLWWTLTGNRVKLMSPWEQLALRTEIEAKMAQAEKLREAKLTIEEGLKVATSNAPKLVEEKGSP